MKISCSPLSFFGSGLGSMEFNDENMVTLSHIKWKIHGMQGVNIDSDQW